MTSMKSQIISKLKDLGRIEERLTTILDGDIFSKLNKYDAFWRNDEGTADRLYDLRPVLMGIEQELWDIVELINRDYNDN